MVAGSAGHWNVRSIKISQETPPTATPRRQVVIAPQDGGKRACRDNRYHFDAGKRLWKELQHQGEAASQGIIQNTHSAEAKYSLQMSFRLRQVRTQLFAMARKNSGTLVASFVSFGKSGAMMNLSLLGWT